MVFIVKMTKEDLQKIRDKFCFNDNCPDEYPIKKILGGEYFENFLFSEIEVLKIAD